MEDLGILLYRSWYTERLHIHEMKGVIIKEGQHHKKQAVCIMWVQKNCSTLCLALQRVHTVHNEVKGN